MQIPNLNAIAPWISKITPKIRHERKPVFLGEFIPTFIDLRFIPHQDPKMFGPIGFQFRNLKNCHELMLT